MMREMLEMGARHQIEGRLPQAEHLFRQALEEQPDNPDALRLLGVLLVQKGEVDQGMELLQAAVSLKPDSVEALSGLGLAHAQKGELDQAEVCLRRALALTPQSAEAHNNLAQALVARGELDAARELLEQALELKPDYAQGLFSLGNVLVASGEPQAALDAYLRAEELAPDDWELKCNLGLLFREGGALEQAETCLRRARLLEPTSPLVALNLASVLLDTGQFQEAEKLSQEACTLLPKFAQAHNHLGLALMGQGRVAEAEMSLIKALTLNPDDHQARANLGFALRLEGKPDKALECFERVLAAQPGMARMEYERATTLLLMDRLEEGWPGLAVRRRGSEPEPGDAPRWQGEDLAGKAVWVWSDGSLAEALLFVRLLPRLKELGARVILECPPLLERLFRASGLGDELVPPGEAPRDADLQVPLDELPVRLDLGAGRVPTSPYFAAPEDLRARWEERLGQEEGLRVGFLWRGEAPAAATLQGIPLGDLAKPWDLPGTRWYSLQFQTTPDEEALLADHPRVQDLAPELEDLSDALACLQGLDLLITPESALAHLAGGAGLAAHVLVSAAPGWWWGLQESSAWYPGLRLHRQGAPGSWETAIQAVRSALERRA